MAGISITLAGNFTKLDELKAKAQKTAGSIKAAFSSGLGKAAFGGIAAGAAAAFAGVVASMKSAIDAGGRLNDMMARTGADGRGLVVMQQAFENVGIAADRVPDVLNKMQKALAGVNEDGEATNHAFGKIGLSIEELRALDPVEAFQRISASIASIQDPADRATAAMEIFGKSGGQLLAVMNDPAAFTTAREQVGSLAETLPGVAGEFDSIGDAFGTFKVKVEQLGTRIAVSLLPVLEAMVELMNSIDLGTFDWTDPFNSDLKPADIERAKQMAKDQAADDPMYMKSRTEVEAQKKAAQDADKAAKQAREDAKAAEKAAKAAEEKAEAERKAAVEREKSKAMLIEEYNLDARILDARIAGNKVRLEALEREKKIREEIKRMESAGFTPAEARKPAEAKVDAEKKADESETKRQAANDEKRRIQEVLAGKVNSARDRLDNSEFQSSLGAVSTMQRIGGGGGAVSSGLDYARQTSDLLRELNAGMRELIQVSRQPVEV